LNQHELLTMGNYAAYLWSHLTYQKWCPFVIRELEELK
jgi:heme exporter protein D